VRHVNPPRTFDKARATNHDSTLEHNSRIDERGGVGHNAAIEPVSDTRMAFYERLNSEGDIP
jgi:hypothetical protein